MPDLSIALTPVLAARLARIALAGIIRAYPHSPAHVLRDADEVRRPRALHPACYGCVDLHSAVHSHWLLVRLLRVLPDLPEAATIRATLDAHLAPANLQVEAASLLRPGAAASRDRMAGPGCSRSPKHAGAGMTRTDGAGRLRSPHWPR